MIVEDRPSSKQAPQPSRGSPDDAEASLEEAKQMITDHPFLTVGGAFAVGALLALLRPRSGSGLVRTAISGLAVSLLRDAMLQQASKYAGHWIDAKSREEAVSRQRETEAFDH